MAVTQITLASTDASGIQGNGNSRRSALSADGQFVAFESDASNLVVGDANGAQDIFLKNLDTGVVRLVSTASDGAQGVGHSSFGGISADGRFVAFNSPATNLVAGDANGQVDVFVKDLATGAVTLASVAADGTRGDGGSVAGSASGGALSADGRFVAFQSDTTNLVAGDTNGQPDVFVKDLATGAVTLASSAGDGTLGNGGSFVGGTSGGGISADGRFVGFASSATNLVAGDANGTQDVFVKDLATGAVTLASATADGIQAAGRGASSAGGSISGDGRFVAFQTLANNLVPGDNGISYDVFIKDVQTGALTRVSVAADGTQGNSFITDGPSISADGGSVAWATFSKLDPADTYSGIDLYVAPVRFPADTVPPATPGNRAPVAVADTAVAAEDGGPVAIAVLANDTDADAGDTKTLVSLNTMGLVGTARIVDGAAVYDPGANFQSLGAGQSATTSFAYTMRDGPGAQGTATVTVTVAGANDAPVAAADGYAASVGRDLAVAAAQGVLANDRDADAGDALRAVLVQGPANGTLALNADGSFTYTPGRGFQGTDVFTYAATDTAGATRAAASVSIDVAAGGGAAAAPVPPAGGGSVAPVSLTAGSDAFTGTRAAETVSGLGGADTLDGAAGGDRLDGGAGSDRLIGGAGNDILTGGADADTFVLGRAGGADVITDFSTAGGDVVALPAGLLRGVTDFAGLRPHLSDANGSAVLNLGGGGNSVTFQGVASAQLAADDFAFV